MLSAGPVDLRVNFLSPVEVNLSQPLLSWPQQRYSKPHNLLKQSIPFSYLAVSAASTDGGSHHVQVYSDISAEWVSGDNTLVANWSTSVGSIITHKVQLENPILFGEINDHTQCELCTLTASVTIDNYPDGSAYYSIINVSKDVLSR